MAKGESRDFWRRGGTATDSFTFTAGHDYTVSAAACRSDSENTFYTFFDVYSVLQYVHVEGNNLVGGLLVRQTKHQRLHWTEK